MNLADYFAIPKTLTVEVDGVTYKDLRVRPPNQTEIGLFERHLEECARQFAERCGDDERPEYRRLAVLEGASGSWTWGSDGYTLALKRPVRIAKLLQFILQGENASLANCPEDAERIALHVVTQRVAEIAAILAAGEQTDPDKKKAILEAVGLPGNFLDSDNSKSTASDSQPPVPSPSDSQPPPN